MLAPTYPLETERLLLRPVEYGDVDAVLAYQSDPESCRYVPFEPRTREQVAERLSSPEATRWALTEPGQRLDLAIVLRESGQLVGDVLLMWHDPTNAEIGYMVRSDQAGRGIATEACRRVLGLAFDDLGVHRVIARIDQRNPASAAVLTKLGMRREAVLVENEWFKGEWSTEEDFAILDREWRASAGL